MQNVTWIWNFSDGVVEIVGKGEPKRYKIIHARRDEIDEFMGTVARARTIHETLVKAHRAFLMGLANYQNAVENLESLISEMRRSENLYAISIAAVAAFFEPSGIIEHFHGHDDRLLEFVDALVPHLEAPK